MRVLLSPDQMRELEREYMARTTSSSIELMERAAERVLSIIERILGPCEGHRAYFACGPGGNGGDGYAAARLFAARGGRAVVISGADESMLRGDARTNCLRAHATPRCFFHEVSDLDALPAPDIWVDALFGIGLTRPLTGPALTLVKRMNTDGRVLAVDIPSGLDGQTGMALGECVHAEWTLTFEREKLGHFLMDGPDKCGALTAQSIDIPGELLPKDAVLLVEDADIAPLCCPRKRNTHKGSYGRVVIVAGSVGMAGACAIAAQAALRAGAGLVQVACPEPVAPIVQTLAPCATCIPLQTENGAIAKESVQLLRQALRHADACAIGPGLSRHCADEVVEAVLCCEKPAVIDADALNLISASDALKARLKGHHVITPHPGEAARLLGRICTDPVKDAIQLRNLGCVALLKGAATVVVGNRIHISCSGTPGMAKGGSGDALTGMLCALLGQGKPPEDAAWLAAHLHGLAGSQAAQAVGEASMTAMDLVDQIGGVLSRGSE